MRETIDELLPALEDPKASYEQRESVCDVLQNCRQYMDIHELLMLDRAVARIREDLRRAFHVHA